MKRLRLMKGQILKIPLENNFHTYGRMMEFLVAFYDARTHDELSIDEIIAKPVLFSVTVYDRCVSEGWWQIVGRKTTLEPQLIAEEQKPAYTEDIFTNKCTIHYADGSRKVVEREEVRGLECGGVWTHISIENRLNDYYAGRYNEEVEHILLGKPMSGMIEVAIRIKKLREEKEKSMVL